MPPVFPGIINWQRLPYILAFVITPTLLVIVAEHVILTRVYKKDSSLLRLTRQLSDSGRTDLVFFLLRVVPIYMFGTITMLITLPGIAYFSAKWLASKSAFAGLLPLGDPGFIWTLVIWYLLFDFGHYISHLLMHRVPIFWRFHKLHHAATEMNIITGGRSTYAERAFVALFTWGLTILLFGLPRPEIALVLVLIRMLIELLQHSDLPWDYGPLRYVLAGPRFHKFHHSASPQDFDTNFGNLFTFWDYAFGTTAKRYREEGSAVADTVDLGLSQPENKHFNRWYYALINETLIDYGIILFKWLRGQSKRNGTASRDADKL